MLKQSHAISEELIEWRRDFHMHPEVGYEVQRTASIVADTLEKFGYRVQRGVGKTGVVAEIGEGGPVVAIRADMDALPLVELNQTDYVSKESGKMHACGHDAHTAMALGAAQLLKDQKLKGRVRFLFQPCEEAADEEGLSGAMRMVEDHAMDGVDFIIAQHVDPDAAVGTIRISEGASGGGVDSWFGTVHGKGGHGAYPYNTVDPFYLTAHVIFALNGLISRRIHPFDPAVVSIGSIQGGFTENVIPDSVRITGTLRFTEKNVQKQLHEEIRRAFEIVKPLGGDYDLKLEIGCQPVRNDVNVTNQIRAVGADILGAANVHKMENSLGAEDFGTFTEHAPGAMFMLGARIEDGLERPFHSPRFDIDERALPLGTALLAETALRFLNSHS